MGKKPETLDDIVTQQVNANRHTERGMRLLEKSMQERGWIGAITVAANGETFDGSARRETMEAVGLEDAIIVRTNGNQPIIHIREDIPTADDPRAVLLGIEANRIPLVNIEFDPGILAGIAESGVDLSGLWFPDEWADVSMPAQDEPEADEPVVIDETKPTRCQAGYVWRIGRHTVACVDSTDRANVEGLLGGRKVGMVVADPPYGIDIVGGDFYVGGGEQYKIPFGGVKKGGHGAFRGEGRTKDNAPTRRYLPVIGDHEPDTAISAATLCLELFRDAIQVWWGANNYSNALPPSRCWIVWDKENTGDFADAELAWCSSDSVVRIFKHMWNGMLKDSERGERRAHPTQKPIALFAWMYDTYGSAADLIFDPFLGSGPSLKAAEASGRTVIGCELSPYYIDHIIEWGEAHGLECERVDD